MRVWRGEGNGISFEFVFWFFFLNSDEENYISEFLKYAFEYLKLFVIETFRPSLY